MSFDARTIADRLEIQDVIARYAFGVDAHDYEAVASCFTADVYLKHGDVYEGKGIEGLIRMVHGLERRHSSMHSTGSQLIQVSGETAQAQTYFTNTMRVLRDGKYYDQINGGLYRDEFIRLDGKWRIRHRVVKHHYRREAPVVLAPGITSY